MLLYPPVRFASDELMDDVGCDGFEMLKVTDVAVGPIDMRLVPLTGYGGKDFDDFEKLPLPVGPLVAELVLLNMGSVDEDFVELMLPPVGPRTAELPLLVGETGMLLVVMFKDIDGETEDEGRVVFEYTVIVV